MATYFVLVLSLFASRSCSCMAAAWPAIGVLQDFTGVHLFRLDHPKGACRRLATPITWVFPELRLDGLGILVDADNMKPLVKRYRFSRMVESLEQRVHLAATAELVDGTLTITGDAGAQNRILLTYSPNRNLLRVIAMPVRQLISTTGLAAIKILGGEANDLIRVNGNLLLPVEVDGGGGNDNIKTANGNDHVHGGAGADIIRTSSGDDVIDGNEGNDYILTGGGSDVVVQSVGRDVNRDFSKTDRFGGQMPEAPARLRVSAATASEVDLNWQDESADEMGFTISRSEDGGSFTDVATVAADSASYRDFSVAAGAVYAYRIAALSFADILSDYAVTSATTPRTLVPGEGFTGPTEQPAAVGKGAGVDAKAIARWDVVPYQTFSGEFNVGVVAFHMNGIDRVEFSVNGGNWSAVREMANNPATGVNEYWVTVDAATVKDQTVEVRAVIYPKVGVPRVLQGATDSGNGEVSMFLTADNDGKLPKEVRYVSPTGSDSNDGLTPQTAKLTTNAAAFSFTNHVADGGTIYLMPGTYTLSGAAFNTNSITSTRWMTIAAAPGVDRSQVVLSGMAVSGSSGFNSKLVRFSNLTITGILQSGGPTLDYGWIDGCAIRGIDWTSGTGDLGVSFSYRYMTNTAIADVKWGPQGYNLIRDVRIDRTGGDAFSNSALVINSSVHEFTSAPGAHTDLWQWVGPAENVIMYGVDNTDGIGRINSAGPTFEVSGANVAVVDSNLSSGTGAYAIYLTKSETHVYFRNTTITGGFYTFGDTLVATDVVYEGCRFSSPIPQKPGVTVR